VRNKTGTVSKGVNRQEGNQTLKTERGEQATLVVSVPSIKTIRRGIGHSFLFFGFSLLPLLAGWVLVCVFMLPNLEVHHLARLSLHFNFMLGKVETFADHLNFKRGAVRVRDN
jgi:uncharacterized membrane protein YdbT with pleckstrin-like domain